MDNTKHKRYIVDERELLILKQFEGITGGIRNPDEYMQFDKESIARFCALKDRLNDMFVRRYEAARAVIDIIAKSVGIDPENTGFWLYAPKEDGTSEITDYLENWVSRSGEKAQLKKRVHELETENSILRDILQK